MKHIYLALFAGFMALLQGLPQQKQSQSNNKTTIVLELDNYICSEEQWVYLHGFKNWISGNEIAIFDSALVKKDQHTVTLEATLLEEHHVDVLFEKRGPLNFSIGAEPNSCIEIAVSEEDGLMKEYKKAKRGDLNNYLHELAERRKDFLRQLKLLKKENKQEEIAQLEDRFFNQLKKEILTTDHPMAVYDMMITFYIRFLNSRNEEVKAIYDQVAAKFPNSRSIQNFARKGSKALPPSIAAERANERLNEIRAQRNKIADSKLETGKQLSLSFKDAAGEAVASSATPADYVLIDFWASWCKPCRKESPYLKQALAKYPERFSIYAVSIDGNHKAWQEAIEADSTQQFRHVIGTFPNGQPTGRLRELNIRAVPANFLVDKEQRIIAKDLRGEELIQVLDSLMR